VDARTRRTGTTLTQIDMFHIRALMDKSIFKVRQTNARIEKCLSLVIHYVHVSIAVASIIKVIPNYSQQDATLLDLFIFTDARHVSGGSSAHHHNAISSTIAVSNSIG